MSAAVDRKRFTTTIQEQALDGNGHPRKGADGKEILIPFKVISNTSLRVQLETEYNNKVRVALTKHNDYEIGCQTIVVILEGLFHNLILAEVKLESGYKGYSADSNVEEVLKAMRRVCLVNADNSVKFQPVELLNNSHNVMNIRQGDCTRDKYIKAIDQRFEAHNNKALPLWYGTPILLHFLKEDGHDWEKYLKGDEAFCERYEQSALGFTKALTFLKVV